MAIDDTASAEPRVSRFMRLGLRVGIRKRRHKGDDFVFAECERVPLRLRRLARLLPRDPRCQLCYLPFRGVGRLIGVQPSRKNPSFCVSCFEAAPIGGYERKVGVLFADVRGFTGFAESRTPSEVADLLNRFYAHATRILNGHGAIVDKLAGDEVMALFLPDFPQLRDRAAPVMVEAAEELLAAVGFADGGNEPWLPLGCGIHFGTAFVGNVGTKEVKDFTAIGDVVNTAERLQGEAGPGEIVVSEIVYSQVGDRYPGAAPMSLHLRGRAEPVEARRLTRPLIS